MKAAGKGGWRNVGTQGKKEWAWFDRSENDNPWEYDNTLLKMAQKRALVAAVLNSTAASDIFTQDVEDLPSRAPEETPKPDGATRAVGNPPAARPDQGSSGRVAVPQDEPVEGVVADDEKDELLTRMELSLLALNGKNGWKKDDVIASSRSSFQRPIETLADLSVRELKEILGAAKQAGADA